MFVQFLCVHALIRVSTNIFLSKFSSSTPSLKNFWIRTWIRSRLGDNYINQDSCSPRVLYNTYRTTQDELSLPLQLHILVINMYIPWSSYFPTLSSCWLSQIQHQSAFLSVNHRPLYTRTIRKGQSFFFTFLHACMILS